MKSLRSFRTIGRRVGRASGVRNGFTIIEILLAMAIFAMIVSAVFASYTAVTKGAVAGNRAAAEAQRSRVALRTIEEALGAARSFAADPQYYTFDTENGSEPYLSFVAHLSPSFPRSGYYGDFDVRRVTFSVEPAPDWGKRLVLRQSLLLRDMTEDEQNFPIVLANDVREFQLEFWDKKKTDWLDEWTDTNQLPQMVKFTLQLGGGQGSEPQDEITRIVALPTIAVAPAWQGPGITPGGAGGGSSHQFGLPQH